MQCRCFTYLALLSITPVLSCQRLVLFAIAWISDTRTCAARRMMAIIIKSVNRCTRKALHRRPGGFDPYPRFVMVSRSNDELDEAVDPTDETTKMIVVRSIVKSLRIFCVRLQSDQPPPAGMGRVTMYTRSQERVRCNG